MKNTFKRLSAFSVVLLALVPISPNARASAGQLYSGGWDTHKVYRFSSSGVQSTFVTAPPTEPNAKYDSIAFDSKGNLFVSDTQNQVLVKITPGGAITTFDSGYAPAFLAFDAAGNLFVGDSGFGNIYKYLPDGTKTTFASSVSGPSGLAFDRAGNLYVAEFNTNSILKFPPNFVVGDTPITFASGLHRPLGLAFDSAGNLFEVDFSTARINKIGPAGGVPTPFATSLSGPRHLAFDRNGNLFASDFGTQRILEFPPNFAVGDMPISFASPQPTTAAGLAFEPPTAELKNISTRGLVQTGDNVMIGGFIVQGTGPKTVIIRAIGPELIPPPYNIPNALADPTLELHDGTGALIGSNDNWQHTIIGGIITSDQVSDIMNSGHAPTQPSESAIIATLQPGNYTAIVRGVNNTVGVALVEVYDLSPF
jgi:sugar lactone lactonase YvrE